MHQYEVPAQRCPYQPLGVRDMRTRGFEGAPNNSRERASLFHQLRPLPSVVIDIREQEALCTLDLLARLLIGQLSIGRRNLPWKVARRIHRAPYPRHLRGRLDRETPPDLEIGPEDLG